jgi:VanZ family protein
MNDASAPHARSLDPSASSARITAWLRRTAYLPVIFWMALIFVGSTDLGSTRHTSRIIGPFLRWFKPDVSDETISAVQALVRKSGHVSEYAVLALLLCRARRLTRALHGWSWREFGIVIACCAAYASTDEFHQLFVSSRQASVVDVMIDTCGATAGMFVLWSLGRWRKIW